MKKLIKINKETLYLVGYFLMGLSAVVIGNSYLFGANRFQICEVVQYLSAVIFYGLSASINIKSLIL